MLFKMLLVSSTSAGPRPERRSNILSILMKLLTACSDAVPLVVGSPFFSLLKPRTKDSLAIWHTVSIVKRM